MSDACSKKINNFCYICGKFTIMPMKKKISPEVAKMYEQYFNISVIRDINWVPSIACSTCVARLYDWQNGRRESMPFGIPMIWSEPINHETDKCYACVNKVQGLNRKKVSDHAYISVPSAQTPLPHSDTVPIPKKPSPTEEYVPPTFESVPESEYSLYQPSNVTSACNHIEISQQRLNIIARQLKLSQNRMIVLTQHLKAVNILAPDVRIYAARGRQREFLQFFTRNENNSFAYCNDIPGLMASMNYTYKAEEWRLFIDGSKSSLKAVLLYIDNSKNPVPIALNLNTKETYDSMKEILDSVKYNEHMWKICADLKVVALLCGLQTGYTRNMCYLCLWETRYGEPCYALQYQKRNWTPRTNRRIGKGNVVNTELVPMERILLPPLHIKLGIVKNFIKVLIKRGNEEAFQRLRCIFPRLSKDKVKQGN